MNINQNQNKSKKRKKIQNIIFHSYNPTIVPYRNV